MVANESSARQVLAFAEALNTKDFERARTFLHEDFSFEGVFGGRKDAKAYMEDQQRAGIRQELLKVFADGDDVAVFYNLSIAHAPGVETFGAGWFQLSNGKIRSLRVVFDPRSFGGPKQP